MSNRWTQYDEDEHRLPEGMTRVGYDADTQRYTFQRGNQLYLGEPGAQYGGNMTRSGVVNGDSEQGRATSNASRRSDGYQPLTTDTAVISNRYANRMFYPFILLMCLFLLVVIKFVNSGDSTLDPPPTSKVRCPDGETAPRYHVKAGDSCWGIANSHHFSVDMLLNQTLNPRLDCDHLKPGDVVCLPLQTTSDSSDI